MQYVLPQLQKRIKNTILLSKEIVQDPNVLLSICRLSDLKLSRYKYRESPHPTPVIDGRDTITVTIINFMRLSGYYFGIQGIVLKENCPFSYLKF